MINNALLNAPRRKSADEQPADPTAVEAYEEIMSILTDEVTVDAITYSAEPLFAAVAEEKLARVADLSQHLTTWQAVKVHAELWLLRAIAYRDDILLSSGVVASLGVLIVIFAGLIKSAPTERHTKS